MFDPHADPHGERTVRSQGAKSAADLILLEKKGRKALEYKDWKAPNQLVRMRSPVQIWVAAPEAIKNRGLTVVRNYLSCGWGRGRCDRKGHAVFLRS